MSSIQLIVHDADTQSPSSPEAGTSDGSTVGQMDPKTHLTFDYSPKNSLIKTLADINAFAAAIPRSHPDRVEALQMLRSLLGQLLGRDSDESLQVALLDTLISFDRELVETHRDGDNEISTTWLDASMDLANTLVKRSEFASGRDGEELATEAIDIGRRRLAQLDTFSLAYAAGSANLALALKALYDRTGDVALLNEATALEQQALSIVPSEDAMWVDITLNLTKSLATHSEATADISVLNEAAELAREALSHCPGDDSARSKMRRNLAVILESVYSRTGDASSLDQSVALLREILLDMSSDAPERPQICSALADSLRMCYQNTSDPGFLREAGRLGEEAIAATPYTSLHWSTIAASLALTYRWWSQMIKGDSMNLPMLEKAIILEKHVVEHRTTVNSAVNFNELRHLSASLYLYHEETSEKAPLQESITLQRQALALCPDDHPTLALICLTLALSLLTMSEFEQPDPCISEAIGLAHRALDVCHSRMKWRARMLLCQAHRIRESSFFDLDKACMYMQQCFFSDETPDEMSLMLTNAINNLILMWPHDDPEAQPNFCRNMLPTYSAIVHLLPVVAGFVLNRSVQLRLLKSYRHLGAEAFLLAVFANEAARGLELLEAVQGLVWAQAFSQRDPGLQKLPPPVAAELSRLLQGSHTPASSLPMGSIVTERDHRHQENRRIQTILKDLRSQPGFERFMMGHSAHELVEVAQDHPVVLLTGSRGYHVAVIICPKKAGRRDISFIPLYEHLSDNDLTQLISFTSEITPGKRGSVLNVDEAELEGDDLRAMAIKRKFTDTMYLKLAVLWRKLVKPILQHPSLNLSPVGVGDLRPRIHWCGTGQFSFLPLHAAGIYDGKSQECCSDYVVSSYIPTLSALLRAQNASAPVLVSNTARVLLVAEKRALDKTLPVIAGVEEELAIVERVARTDSEASRMIAMISGGTTVESLAAELATANITHLACHGIQDSDDALQSGFCLGDGKLTVSRLMNLKLDNSFLAFLSACETATGDSNQPDQVIHLAAAMLFAGFRSVVATMWSMHDIDGPRVAEWFYENLLSRPIIDADSVAYALDEAVGKLRASGVAPQRWAPFVHLGL